MSYHHQDSEWVRQELRPRLEDAEPRFRLCLHERDFVVGATVADNICTAVDISRRMVLLLSRAFLQSHWCHEEFRQAHYKVICIFIFMYFHFISFLLIHFVNLNDPFTSYIYIYIYIYIHSHWFPFCGAHTVGYFSRGHYTTSSRIGFHEVVNLWVILTWYLIGCMICVNN